MPKSPKLIAKQYITPHILFNMCDCSDSMRQCDRLEAQWEAVTDNELRPIGEYIKNVLEKEYRSEVKRLAKENGYTDDMCAGTLLFPISGK